VANLIEGIQAECNRVRELLPRYEAIGPAGRFGLLMLKAGIAEGEAAIASGDVIRMLGALKALQGCEG
jgi:hypothetical protein